MTFSLLSGAWSLVAAIAFVFFIFYRVYWKGRRIERLEEQARRTDAMREKKKIDDEVDALGNSDLDDRFNRWMRNRHK